MKRRHYQLRYLQSKSILLDQPNHGIWRYLRICFCILLIYRSVCFLLYLAGTKQFWVSRHSLFCLVCCKQSRYTSFSVSKHYCTSSYLDKAVHLVRLQINNKSGFHFLHFDQLFQVCLKTTSLFRSDSQYAHLSSSHWFLFYLVNLQRSDSMSSLVSCKIPDNSMLFILRNRRNHCNLGHQCLYTDS